jgi:hypothetical protein
MRGRGDGGGCSDSFSDFLAFVDFRDLVFQEFVAFLADGQDFGAGDAPGWWLLVLQQNERGREWEWEGDGLDTVSRTLWEMPAAVLYLELSVPALSDK